MTISRTAAAVCIMLASAAPAAFFTPAAAADNGPCRLLTTAEASAAMHAPSLPGKFVAGKNDQSCRYYSTDHTKNVFLQTADAETMKAAGQYGGKRIPGVGDSAVWSSGSVFVQKGGKVMQVGLYITAASMTKMDPTIVPLAKQVASRM